MTDQNNETETLQSEVATVVEEGIDIRAKVRDLTMKALLTHELDFGGIRQVMGAVSEGISIGAKKHASNLKGALSDGFAGMDDALRKSAEATHLALRQLVSQGKDFTDTDLREALHDLKALEEDFLSTVSKVAEKAGEKVRQELGELVSHARRAGTDTGTVVASTLNEMGHRLGATAKEGSRETAGAAKEIKTRLSLLASGVLLGMADALDKKTKH
jgi:hypothetical protein